MAIAMKNIFDDNSSYTMLESCLRAFTITPFTCKVEKLTTPNGDFHFRYYDVKAMEPIPQQGVIVMSDKIVSLIRAYVYYEENSAKFVNYIVRAYNACQKFNKA